jgi:hypothetical protein
MHIVGKHTFSGGAIRLELFCAEIAEMESFRCKQLECKKANNDASKTRVCTFSVEAIKV